MDTNKIIGMIAQEKLSPLGLRQKRQSRLWYFSGDYYLILVEFQPSSWDKGTYLNVGLDFNWYPKDYFAFEFGDRLSDFHKSIDEEQFERDVQNLCDRVLDKINMYKTIFIDKATAGEKLLRLHKDKANYWEKFHIGLLFGIGGQKTKSIDYLREVVDTKHTHDWEIERAETAKEYIEALEYGDFFTKLGEVVARTKELKKIS